MFKSPEKLLTGMLLSVILYIYPYLKTIILRSTSPFILFTSSVRMAALVLLHFKNDARYLQSSCKTILRHLS